MEHNVKNVFKYQINKPELKERFMDFVYKNKGKYGIHVGQYNEDEYFTTTLFSENLVKAFYESLNKKWFSQDFLKNKNYIETRGPYTYSPRELLSGKDDIDYDIILSNGKKLQREFVWTIEQKRELILSILKDIPIGQFQVINYTHGNNRSRDKQTFKIVDGKQRLSTVLDFVQGKFGFIWDEVEYFIDDLELFTKLKFKSFSFDFNVVYEYEDKRLTDEQLIGWFERVNFAGTPQDKEHLEYLKKK